MSVSSDVFLVYTKIVLNYTIAQLFCLFLLNFWPAVLFLPSSILHGILYTLLPSNMSCHLAFKKSKSNLIFGSLKITCL